MINWIISALLVGGLIFRYVYYLNRPIPRISSGALTTGTQVITWDVSNYWKYQVTFMFVAILSVTLATGLIPGLRTHSFHTRLNFSTIGLLLTLVGLGLYANWVYR